MPDIEIARSSSVPASRPRDVFDAMRQEIGHMFERLENGWPRWPSLFRHGDGAALVVPDLDIYEHAKSVTIEADLPGVEERDVFVMLAIGVLTIKGERKQAREKKNGNYYLAERSFGTFERSIRLPDTIDDGKIEAHFEKGVLKVTAAKKSEAVKAERKIDFKQA